MFTPQQLRVLVALRECRSLTAAAAFLGYGVPTIAHHLRTLEQQVGAPLVDRDRRGAKLTPLGVALAQEGDQILTRLSQAERLIAAQRDAGLTTLRVGTFASIGSRLLPAAIRELRERIQVQVEVIEAEPTDVVRMLRDGEIHAGLIYDVAGDPAFTSRDLDLTVLLEESYEVLVARTSALAAQPVLDFADLAEADWVCSRNEGEASDRVLLRTCRSVGFEPRVLMRTDDLNMIHGLVAEGLGCTITTAAAVDERFSVALRPALQVLGQRRTSFVAAQGVSLPVIAQLRAILTDRASAHAG